MSARRYPVVIEKTGTGYSAYSPDVSGCVAVGETEEETRQSFQDALVAHFQAMREVGEPTAFMGLHDDRDDRVAFLARSS